MTLSRLHFSVYFAYVYTAIFQLSLSIRIVYSGSDTQGITFAASKCSMYCPRCCFKEITPSLEMKITRHPLRYDSWQPLLNQMYINSSKVNLLNEMN